MSAEGRNTELEGELGGARCQASRGARHGLGAAAPGAPRDDLRRAHESQDDSQHGLRSDNGEEAHADQEYGTEADHVDARPCARQSHDVTLPSGDVGPSVLTVPASDAAATACHGRRRGHKETHADPRTFIDAPEGHSCRGIRPGDRNGARGWTTAAAVLRSDLIPKWRTTVVGADDLLARSVPGGPQKEAIDPRLSCGRIVDVGVRGSWSAMAARTSRDVRYRVLWVACRRGAP